MTVPDPTDLTTNAGRCDLCGGYIDMSSGDTLAIADFGVDPETAALIDNPDADQAAADAVADAVTRLAKAPIDHTLASTIRHERAYRVHDRCLTKTVYDQLTVPEGEYDA